MSNGPAKAAERAANEESPATARVRRRGKPAKRSGEDARRLRLAEHDGDDGFGVLDLAAVDEVEGFGDGVAFDGEDLVDLERLFGLGQAGGEIEMHFFGKKAG